MLHSHITPHEMTSSRMVLVALDIYVLTFRLRERMRLRYVLSSVASIFHKFTWILFKLFPVRHTNVNLNLLTWNGDDVFVCGKKIIPHIDTGDSILLYSLNSRVR